MCCRLRAKSRKTCRDWLLTRNDLPSCHRHYAQPSRFPTATRRSPAWESSKLTCRRSGERGWRARGVTIYFGRSRGGATEDAGRVSGQPRRRRARVPPPANPAPRVSARAPGPGPQSARWNLDTAAAASATAVGPVTAPFPFCPNARRCEHPEGPLHCLPPLAALGEVGGATPYGSFAAVTGAVPRAAPPALAPSASSRVDAAYYTTRTLFMPSHPPTPFFPLSYGPPQSAHASEVGRPIPLRPLPGGARRGTPTSPSTHPSPSPPSLHYYSVFHYNGRPYVPPRLPPLAHRHPAAVFGAPCPLLNHLATPRFARVCRGDGSRHRRHRCGGGAPHQPVEGGGG